MKNENIDITNSIKIDEDDIVIVRVQKTPDDDTVIIYDNGELLVDLELNT